MASFFDNSDNISMGSSFSSGSRSESASSSSPSSNNSLSGFESDSSTNESENDSSSTTSNDSYRVFTLEGSSMSSGLQEEDTVSSGHIQCLPSLNPRKDRARLIQQANRTEDDDDNGLACSLCLQKCEMSGDHRLSSLKCGHFFGESCLRQRLKENTGPTGIKVCPECKTKARERDIRFLYAKRLKVIDRSEETRMREQLNQERTKTQILEFELDSMKMSYEQVTQKMQSLEADNKSLKELLLRNGTLDSYTFMERTITTRSVTYKLCLDRKIAISRKPCCRVMKYANRHSKLVVSQKGFFPGYGLRLMNAPSFESSNYLYTSQKMVCDLSLSPDQNLVAVASKERTSKLFDMRNFQSVTVFKPSKQPIMSCAISSKESEYKLFLGSQHGSTFVYDTRHPGSVLDEHKTGMDGSAVLQIESIQQCELFPFGGFIICQMSSLWFYEYSENGAVQSTCLMAKDNFISMNYNNENRTLLLQTGSCPDQPRVRHILGKLNKIDSIPAFQIDVIFFALSSSPVVARSAQINLNSNTLVAAYIQDQKLLSLYDANSEQCLQSLPVPESKIFYDLCPIYTNDCTYLAALNKSKCFIYRLSSSS